MMYGQKNIKLCHTESSFLSGFKGTWISRQIFEKYSNIEFHNSLSSGSGVVPWRQTGKNRARQTWRN